MRPILPDGSQEFLTFLPECVFGLCYLALIQAALTPDSKAGGPASPATPRNPLMSRELRVVAENSGPVDADTTALK